MKPVNCPKCGRTPLVLGCDVFCAECVDGSPDCDQLVGSGKSRDTAIENWNEMVACHVDNVAARRDRRAGPVESLSLASLQGLAWSMAEVVEDPQGDPHARRYAKLLNSQAHAEIARRAS